MDLGDLGRTWTWVTLAYCTGAVVTQDVRFGIGSVLLKEINTWVIVWLPMMMAMGILAFWKLMHDQ